MTRLLPALLLLGCGRKTTRDADYTVDCAGMSFIPQVFNYSKSPLLSYDAASDAMVERCSFAYSPTLTGGEVSVVSGASIFQFGSVPDLANVQITAFGQSWTSLSGSLQLAEYDYSKAAGAYEVTAVGVDLVTGEQTTSQAKFAGSFDWCASSSRADCPHEFADVLTDEVSITSPAFGSIEGKSTACRMLYDPATQALQVDMQLGAWNGDNVGQLWVGECGAGGEIPPQSNLFRFRAGGFTGPGAYGPVASRSFPGTRLPELYWSHPMTFTPGLNDVQACSVYSYTGQLDISDATTCTYAVDADAGRFTADCSEVRQVSPYSVISYDETGDFHIAMDCTYLERSSAP